MLIFALLVCLLPPPIPINQLCYLDLAEYRDEKAESLLKLCFSLQRMKWDGFDAEMLMGFEEIEADDNKREEYTCPFCSEYFDIVGLCCHIDDEHPIEAKNGVCPVCSLRVGVDMIAHVILQHGNIFKMQSKRKSRRAGSHSSLSLLRRELREGNLQFLFGGLSTIVSSGNAAPDPLLSSFIVPMVEELEGVPPHSSIESESSKKSNSNNILDRVYYRDIWIWTGRIKARDKTGGGFRHAALIPRYET